MPKSINIFNKVSGENDSYFFERLERELWAWDKCFNCSFCWDIISETWIIKDSVIECLWQQAGITNIKIDETCGWHKILDNYYILRKWD